MPPVEHRAPATKTIEQLPPLPTKEDRLYGAFLVFRKANEGPHLRTSITVDGRDLTLLYRNILAEALVLKEKYKLTKEEAEAAHITPKEIEEYVRKQEGVILDRDVHTRILRPDNNQTQREQSRQKTFFGVPVPHTKPIETLKDAAANDRSGSE